MRELGPIPFGNGRDLPISRTGAASFGDLFGRTLRGEALPFARTAEVLLKARHDALELRLKRHRARLQDDESKARGTINAAADAVR